MGCQHVNPSMDAAGKTCAACAVLHRCKPGSAKPVHRAQRCQIRSGNAKSLTEMSPQQPRNHPNRIEEHPQKPDLQRKTPPELGPATLLDKPAFVGRELEEHLDLDGPLPRAAGAADQEMSHELRVIPGARFVPSHRIPSLLDGLR